MCCEATYAPHLPGPNVREGVCSKKQGNNKFSYNGIYYNRNFEPLFFHTTTAVTDTALAAANARLRAQDTNSHKTKPLA
jgi:hypothetical protein